MEWDEKTIELLKAYWKEGISTSQIGQRLNVSKNAIVGKAHRLDLDGRPSPIIRGNSIKPSKPIPAPQKPIPHLALPTSLVEPPARPPPLQPPPPQQASAPIPTIAHRATRLCCWPIGHPGTPGFHFCGVEVCSSKPYCEDHVKLAYVKERGRIEVIYAASSI